MKFQILSLIKEMMPPAQVTSLSCNFPFIKNLGNQIKADVQTFFSSRAKNWELKKRSCG